MLNKNNVFFPFFQIALLLLTNSLGAMDKAELEKIIKSNFNKVKALNDRAEKNRDQQPDFADWVMYQKNIHDSFKKAALYDFKFKKDRLKATLTDWGSLIKRMGEECSVYENQFDPEKTEKINVKDFGAKGDGINNDAPAFREAFKKANSGRKRYVFIPAGKYLLDYEKANDPECIIFNLKNYKDILISGEKGTVLIAKSPRALVFKLDSCDNVRLKNFHRTSMKPFCTTGIIVAIPKENVINVKIDKNCLSPLDPIFAESDGKGLVRVMSGEILADGKTLKSYCIPEARPFWRSKVRSLGNNIFEFVRPKSVHKAVYKKGQRVVYYARDHRKSMVNLINSKHCRIDNISIDSSSGMAFYSMCSDATFITRCKIEAPENSFFATAADGLYSQWASLGSYVAKNTFKNLGDDYFNVNSLLLPVHIQEGNILYVNSYLPDDFLQHLTQIAIMHCPQGQDYVSEIYFLKSVKHVTKSYKGQDIKLLRLELDRFPGTLKTTSPEIRMKECHKLRAFKKAKFDMVYFSDLHSSGMVFANNNYAHGPSRILPIGSNSLMVNNHFDDRLDLHVLSEFLQKYMSWWEEAYYSRNVTVKDNKFKCLHKTVISFESSRFNPNDINSYTPHFYITGNEISLLPGQNHQAVFRIKGNDDIEVVDNKITAIGGKKRGPVFNIRFSRVKLKNNITKGDFSPNQIGQGVTFIK